MGNRRRQFRPDAVHHPIDIVTHCLIREAQGLESFAQQNGVPEPVMFDTTFVTSPIHLNDQSAAIADEIEIVAAEWRLPSEVEAVDSQSAKTNPEARLGRS